MSLANIMRSATEEIAIRDLVVGQPLIADILDPTGRVLLKKGHVLSQTVVDRWYALGFQKVLVPASDRPIEQGLQEARALRPYDEALVQEINLCIGQSKQAIEQMLVDLVVRDQPRLRALQAVLNRIARALASDSDAVIANAHREVAIPSATANERLIRRSVALSTLAAATAAQMEMNEGDQLTIALAGALHDLALFEETRALWLGDRPSAADRAAHFLQHGELSGELLGDCPDLPIQVRVIVSQVHEQIDGTGFPRGLSANLLSVHSRILNLVDAYLTLIDPSEHQTFVPADALAYLVRQTTRGAFDLPCMRGMLKALSIYPVGSSVVLDDGSTALVLRSTGSDPLRPVVRADNSSHSVLDLRHSGLSIVGPSLVGELTGRRRMRRSELDTILWQPRLMQRA